MIAYEHYSEKEYETDWHVQRTYKPIGWVISHKVSKGKYSFMPLYETDAFEVLDRKISIFWRLKNAE